MKITITKRELLALAFHVQPKPVQSMDQAKYRRSVWKAFGASEMATDVGELARSPRVNVSLDWMDRTASVEGDLEPLALDWLIGTTKPPYDGPDADFLMDIHERLVEAKARG